MSERYIKQLKQHDQHTNNIILNTIEKTRLLFLFSLGCDCCFYISETMGSDPDVSFLLVAENIWTEWMVALA